MSAEMWVAIITGAFTLAGVIITVSIGNSKTLYRIEQLEKKQDKYNHLQERVANIELHDAKYDQSVSQMCGDVRMIKKKLFKEL